jgi:hypothetical protein
MLAIVARLESGGFVSGSIRFTSDVVWRAIDDAEALLSQGGPTSAVDRVHTSLHGHLRYLCEEAGVSFGVDDTMVALFKKLRQGHPRIGDLGPRGQDIETVLNALRRVVGGTMGDVIGIASVQEETGISGRRRQSQFVLWRTSAWQL